MEARTHARNHGADTKVEVLNRQHGPKPDVKRDAKIIALRSEGHSARVIAAIVKMSHAGALEALRRIAQRTPQ